MSNAHLQNEKAFVNEGFDQGHSSTTRLAKHEKSNGHFDAMTSCCEAGAILSKKKQASTRLTRRRD